LPETDLTLLIDAAKNAGRIALKHFHADPEIWDKPDGAGPVTEADLEVDRMLNAELRSARPEYGWLSEETADTADRLSTNRQFIIDPIDGTRAFIDRAKCWSHSLAIVENGQTIHGVVYLPMRDQVFAASRGQGATLNGEPIRVSHSQTMDDATVLAAKSNLKPEHWQGNTPPIQRHFRSALAYRMCLVAQGRFDAMITLRPSWEWDIAAGSLIISEAGGQVSDQMNAALHFNNAHPQVPGVVAAGPDLHALLHAHLS
jgi:myo-inositol-1(or 4)-monophosphatase